MNSLATKLSLAFVLVVVLGVASVSLLARRETTQGFQSYLESGGRMYATRVVEVLADLYRREGSWQGAQSAIQGQLRGPYDRLVLADASGTVVADSGGALLGRKAEGLESVSRFPVAVEGRSVGTLYLAAFSPGGGPGGAALGRGKGPVAGSGKERGVPSGQSVQQVAPTLEATYLASVDRAILVAALLSALAAITLGLWIARRITRPLADLSDAAKEVAAGKLAHRVKVPSGDELGQVASAFNTMAESLERNEQARRRMVADIAHELRTPLTVIEGTVDGMLDGVFDLDRGNLESVKEEVALLTKLVADLRTLSLAEAGQLSLEREPVDLVELARRAVARVEPLAQRKAVSCRLEGNGAVPEVEVDPERMGQVLGNLLDNAVRHTHRGGTITVSVGVSRDGPTCPSGDGSGQGCVAISVADTGEGVPLESLPHLFDRFYRADESRSRKSGGSGLGLAIVKQLVEAHGGRVWAESEPGKGSRFVVELPAVKHPS